VGVHIAGVTNGVAIRGNHIEAADGSKEVDAVLIEDCHEENPLVSGNAVIKAQSPSAASRAHAIRSAGGCPFIEINQDISVEPAADGGEAYAIRCSGGNGCRILGNRSIQVARTSSKAVVAAVSCEGASSCPLVSHNDEIGGGTGQTTTGILLSQADGLVNDNTKITGGCGTVSAVAIRNDQSSTELVDNTIVDETCTAASETSTSVRRGRR
jgi:hypothetical protein